MKRLVVMLALWRLQMPTVPRLDQYGKSIRSHSFDQI
jgi:hypothetical protein